MSRLLRSTCVGLIAMACSYSSSYQPIPDNPWLVIYKSSGGPGPVISEIALYRDGRIFWRADPGTLHQSRLTEVEISKVSRALGDSELAEGVRELAALGYQSGCCDVEDIVVRGRTEFDLACWNEAPPSSVVQLLSTVGHAVRAHFGPVEILCGDWRHAT